MVGIIFARLRGKYKKPKRGNKAVHVKPGGGGEPGNSTDCTEREVRAVPGLDNDSLKLVEKTLLQNPVNRVLNFMLDSAASAKQLALNNAILVLRAFKVDKLVSELKESTPEPSNKKLHKPSANPKLQDATYLKAPLKRIKSIIVAPVTRVAKVVIKKVAATIKNRGVAKAAARVVARVFASDTGLLKALFGKAAKHADRGDKSDDKVVNEMEAAMEAAVKSVTKSSQALDSLAKQDPRWQRFYTELQTQFVVPAYTGFKQQFGAKLAQVVRGLNSSKVVPQTENAPKVSSGVRPTFLAIKP